MMKYKLIVKNDKLEIHRTIEVSQNELENIMLIIESVKMVDTDIILEKIDE